jgi:hypothetical protein
MAAAKKVLIEAKPENPGRLTLFGRAGEPEVLQLAPMKPNELSGLVKELRARGLDVDLVDTDVEAKPAALTIEAALLALGFEQP